MSSRVFNDGKRIVDIRDGSDVGVRRLARAMAWFSAHWPADLAWPAAIARPLPIPQDADRVATAAPAGDLAAGAAFSREAAE